jgi:hypothetical protein
LNYETWNAYPYALSIMHVKIKIFVILLLIWFTFSKREFLFKKNKEQFKDKLLIKIETMALNDKGTTENVR